MNDRYRIVDNALPNPHEVKKFLSSLTHYTSESYELPGLKFGDPEMKPKGSWRGFRSTNLSTVDKINIEAQLKFLLEKAFLTECSFYESEVYSHFTSSRMHKEIPPNKRWHKDDDNCAGVLYLNENPPQHSGTFLNVNNEVIEVENKFNRLVVYDGNYYHAPGILFGDDISNARHTYTFFVNGFVLGKR